MYHSRLPVNHSETPFSPAYSTSYTSGMNTSSSTGRAQPENSSKVKLKAHRVHPRASKQRSNTRSAEDLPHHPSRLPRKTRHSGPGTPGWHITRSHHHSHHQPGVCVAAGCNLEPPPPGKKKSHNPTGYGGERAGRVSLPAFCFLG